MNVVLNQLHDLYHHYLDELSHTNNKVRVLNKWSNRLHSIYRADYTNGVHQFIYNWLKTIDDMRASIK